VDEKMDGFADEKTKTDIASFRKKKN